MNANLKPNDSGLDGLSVFRADQVGSFLRPKYLLDARAQAAKGEITPAQLRAVEDKAIAEVVKFQEEVGLKSITDGEFRREYFPLDFLKQLGGVQRDDTNLAYLCDEGRRGAARKRGDDPNELPHRYASFVNRVVAQKPAGMTLGMHLWRGNFKSTCAAQGGWEPVAEALLSEMNGDAYFLE